eukprot:252737-Chlamydomonas_euryale.AAC.2
MDHQAFLVQLSIAAGSGQPTWAMHAEVVALQEVPQPLWIMASSFECPFGKLGQLLGLANDLQSCRRQAHTS